MIKTLLARGADVHACAILGSFAAAYLDARGIEMLVNAGMAFVVDQEMFETAFSYGNASALDFMLTNYLGSAYLQQPVEYYGTFINRVLHQRGFYDHGEFIDVFIKHNAPFTMQDFATCCSLCSLETIHRMIARLPEEFSIARYISCLAENRNPEVINHFYPLFLATNPSVTALQLLLWNCVRGNHIYLFADLVKRGANVNAVYRDTADSLNADRLKRLKNLYAWALI